MLTSSAAVPPPASSGSQFSGALHRASFEVPPYDWRLPRSRARTLRAWRRARGARQRNPRRVAGRFSSRSLHPRPRVAGQSACCGLRPSHVKQRHVDTPRRSRSSIGPCSVSRDHPRPTPPEPLARPCTLAIAARRTATAASRRCVASCRSGQRRGSLTALGPARAESRAASSLPPLREVCA